MKCIITPFKMLKSLKYTSLKYSTMTYKSDEHFHICLEIWLKGVFENFMLIYPIFAYHTMHNKKQGLFLALVYKKLTP